MHKVFQDVAASYDLMNDAMSLGIHRVWKDIFIERLGPTPGTKLLDMAGGTGDIAFRYIKYLNNAQHKRQSPIKSHVTVSDINQNMLDVGKQRALNLQYTNDALDNCTIDWVCANAEQLPFEDNSFNAYTIAFGIRNCTHIDKVIFCFCQLRIKATWKKYCIFHRLFHLIEMESTFRLICFFFLVFKGGSRSISCSAARWAIYVFRI